MEYTIMYVPLAMSKHIHSYNQPALGKVTIKGVINLRNWFRILSRKPVSDSADKSITLGSLCSTGRQGHCDKVFL